MEDTFFTGRALFEELARHHFFGSEKNVQDTGVLFQDATLFFNTLGVFIQETLGPDLD